MMRPAYASHESAAAVNVLAEFCGPRDVPTLTPTALRASYGWDRADLVVLFGGSLLSGADTFAEAVRHQVAETTMIVGGEGHTTSSLRDSAAAALPGVDVRRMAEADIFAACLERTRRLTVDLLERRSTNCGANITNALEILVDRAVPLRRVILIQDATMQRRMSAGFRLHVPDARIVNFAAYAPRVRVAGESLAYAEAPPDMWPLDRYVGMLLGEIERLRDDEHGYGPNGRGWIAHEPIPDAVNEAFEALTGTYGFSPRTANPRWAG